jgi:AcrR family transcriptional regulator
MAHATALSPNRAAKRDMIVAAAVEVLLRDGVYACTARSIASAAGVSKGALHYYFADVDEIVDLAMRHAVGLWMRWVGSDGARADDPATRLWRTLDACLKPLTGGDRTLMPLWLEYWAACMRSGRTAPLREMQDTLVSHLAHLLDAAGVEGSRTRAASVVAYLFGAGVQQTVQGTNASTLQRDVAALCGISPPQPTTS